jgi:hypothetical protein
MARDVSRNALVLWRSGKHLNRPCNSSEARKRAGKLNWPTLENVGMRYIQKHKGAVSQKVSGGY